MTDSPHPIYQVLRDDPRYTIEAYQFVREALSYAQEVMGLGIAESVPGGDTQHVERHLTGQELCEASRRYALEQYGLLAKTVLKTWGIDKTDDLGEIVYNLIKVDLPAPFGPRSPVMPMPTLKLTSSSARRPS